MLDTQTVTSILSTLVLVSDIFIVSFILLLIYNRITKKIPSFFKPILTLIIKHGLLFAFLVALVSTSGSLFYSEVAGYTPCNLCWYQRILMYPQVILLGIAVLIRDKDVSRYTNPLNILGIILASYHFYTQFAPSFGCSFDTAVDCTTKYTFHYGYVTIPMMALTGFILIFIFTFLYKKFKEVV